MFRILVIEDDAAARDALERTLFAGGYEPVVAGTCAQALAYLERHCVELIVLEWLLPDAEGSALLEPLRCSGSRVPVLVISPRRSMNDMRRCYGLGADDYLTKPVDPEELLLRIGALLRRARISSEHCLQVGMTTLRYDALTVTRNGVTTALPPKEFLLLFKLLSYPGKIFTRRQLMNELWDLDSESGDHTISVHINRLRSRFRDNPDFRIVTVRNLGYKGVRTDGGTQA